MEFFTSGNKTHKDFKLPLIYKKQLVREPLPLDYMSLILITEGAVSFLLENSEKVFTAPSVLWIKDSSIISRLRGRVDSVKIHNLIFRPSSLNDTHEIDWDYDNTEGPFYFSPFRLNEDKGYTVLTISEHSLLRIENLLDRLNTNLNHQETPDFWPCLSRSYFMEILILLQRTFYMNQHETGIEYPSTPPELEPVVEYIFNNYHKPLQLDEISSLFGTNRTTLNNQFKAFANTSVMDFISGIRCDIAAGMLRKTLLPITEISTRVGIDDQSYFARFFKKRTGCSPSEYRKSHPDPYLIIG